MMLVPPCISYWLSAAEIRACGWSNVGRRALQEEGEGEEEEVDAERGEKIIFSVKFFSCTSSHLLPFRTLF